MKRPLCISLSLVLALVGLSSVCAEDGFYVISSVKKSPPLVLGAAVSKTGQTVSYGTRDDGALKEGVAWPTPRFTDNGNGTVLDNLTGLIWMKDAKAIGKKNWWDALTAANGLKSGDFDLNDGSQAGDWRLPNIKELRSLLDHSKYDPPLPTNHPFNVNWDVYWTSTTNPGNTDYAWFVSFNDASTNRFGKAISNYVWCVRGGP